MFKALLSVCLCLLAVNAQDLSSCVGDGTESIYVTQDFAGWSPAAQEDLVFGTFDDTLEIIHAGRYFSELGTSSWGLTIAVDGGAPGVPDVDTFGNGPYDHSRYVEAEPLQNIQVKRQTYVGGSNGWLRYVDSFTNVDSVAHTVTVQYSTLTFPNFYIEAASTGDTVTTETYWAVAADDTFDMDPIGWIWRFPGDQSQFTPTNDMECGPVPSFEGEYTFSLPAGKTAVILHYVIVGGDSVEAVSRTIAIFDFVAYYLSGGLYSLGKRDVFSSSFSSSDVHPLQDPESPLYGITLEQFQAIINAGGAGSSFSSSFFEPTSFVDDDDGDSSSDDDGDDDDGSSSNKNSKSSSSSNNNKSSSSNGKSYLSWSLDSNSGQKPFVDPYQSIRKPYSSSSSSSSSRSSRSSGRSKSSSRS